MADFGLAKIVHTQHPSDRSHSSDRSDTIGFTEAGQVMGTPQYMAPEQTERPSEVDHRADIYSLGVVFYQMLTGELPGKTLEPPSRKVLIDVRLDEVVLRALEQQPERRYQQVGEVKTMVETIVTEGWKSEGRSPVTESSTPKMRWRDALWDALTVFQPPLVRDIFEHMTATEKRVLFGRGLPVGMVFLGLGVSNAQLLDAPNPARWLWAGISFAAICALMPIWIRVRRQFLCSTSWARQQGITPEKIETDARAFRGGAATCSGAPPIHKPEAVVTPPPRFSRTAIVGAAWIGIALVGVLTISGTDPVPDLPWWQKLIGYVFTLLTIAAPLGATILGWVAVTQIRRSGGNLYGLGLAAFAGLLFPLLALDGLIGWGWFIALQSYSDFNINPANFHLHNARQGLDAFPLQNLKAVLLLATLITVVVVDGLLIWWAWRAVKKPVGGAMSNGAGVPPASADMRTWAPFQPPLVREICAHMTAAEQRDATKRGLLFGFWNAMTCFGPFCCVMFIPGPTGWILGVACLVVGLSFYPLWRRMQHEFLCSTEWARQQAIKPDQLQTRAAGRCPGTRRAEADPAAGGRSDRPRQNVE